MSQIFTQKSGQLKTPFANNDMGGGNAAHPNPSKIRQQHMRSTADESLSYKAIMELKGSKCTCMPKFTSSGMLLSNANEANEQSKAPTVCGTFCKHLTAKQQKKVVLRLIRQEQNRQMTNRQWEPKRYLINQRWWTQWCDFVNFDSKLQLDNSCDVNLLPKQKSQLDSRGKAGYHSQDLLDSQTSEFNDGISADSDPDSNLDRAHGSAEDGSHLQLYERPQRICNADLLDPNVAKGLRQRLKPDLIEHFDFEMLCPSVWKHLYSWYSADVQIVRSLKKDVLNRHVMILDLYPDTEARHFTGYEYASGCQNLQSGRTSTHNSARAARAQVEDEQPEPQRSRPDKPTFNLSDLKRAQQDFLRKGATAADSPREMTGASNTMAQTAAFVGRASEPTAGHFDGTGGATASRKQAPREGHGGANTARTSDLEATVKQHLHSMRLGRPATPLI